MSSKGFLVLFSGLACLIGIAVYYAPFVNFRVLYGEIEVERWATMMKTVGGPGRDCFYASYGDVNEVLRSMGRKALPNRPGELVVLPVHCLAKMHLVKMTYYGQYNVVSGVYRCEENGLIQELQLAVYLEPRSVPQEDYCRVGSFAKAWDIPAGRATMFATP